MTLALVFPTMCRLHFKRACFQHNKETLCQGVSLAILCCFFFPSASCVQSLDRLKTPFTVKVWHVVDHLFLLKIKITLFLVTSNVFFFISCPIGLEKKIQKGLLGSTQFMKEDQIIKTECGPLRPAMRQGWWGNLDTHRCSRWTNLNWVHFRPTLAWPGSCPVHSGP